MNQTFLGIDLGTTFLKGAVLHLDTLQVGHTERLAFPEFVTGLPPARREVDPRAIATAVRDLVRRLLPYAHGCAGIAVCTQMHGLVLCDVRGTPLSNAITWQDQRTLEPHPSGGGSWYDVMSQAVSADERLEVGNDLWAIRPLSTLYWMQQQAGALPATGGSAYPATLPDFVLAHLCGSEPTTDLTNAAAYGALNLKSGDWHGALIDRLGLAGLHWPRIRPLGEVAGVLRIDGATLPCYTPVGDHQCAVLGTLLRDNELSINVSTGSQVGLLTTQLEVSEDYQTRPYFDGRYLKAVIHIPAGRALNALVRLLSEMAEAQGVRVPDPWAYIERVTAPFDHTDLLVNLAFFPSSCGDAGALWNAREENLTVGHLFTGAFENMAENYVACANRISPAHAWRKLVFSGGLVQKLDPLRRAILARFDAPYRFPPTSEDTMLGLLVLALVFSGREHSVGDATDAVRRALEGGQEAVGFN